MNRNSKTRFAGTRQALVEIARGNGMTVEEVRQEISNAILLARPKTDVC